MFQLNEKIFKYAIVDIGANSVRMNIYDIDTETGAFSTALSIRSMLGLAAYAKDGALTSDGIGKLFAVLREFLARANSFPCDAFSAFATASLRGLSNSAKIVRDIKSGLGIEIDIISGELEASYDEDAAFTLGPKHILFDIGSATVVCRLLEGDFLDWRKVVPTNCPIKLVAHVSDLASSIERVGLIVSEKYKSPVRCVFSDQVLQLRTNTTIGAAEDRCAIAGDGKELEIGFNVRYLADALRVIPSEEVVLELTNGLSPIVMTPAEEKYDYSYMVLPVRIKNS